MAIQPADAILGLGFAGAVIGGFRQGFVRQLVGLGILAGAALLALHLGPQAAALVRPFLAAQPGPFVEMAGSALVFLAVEVGGNLVAAFFYRRVPFLAAKPLLDGLLGGALSLGIRLLEVAVVLIILDSFFALPVAAAATSLGPLGGLHDLLQHSAIAAALRTQLVPLVLVALSPFVPAQLRDVVRV